MTSVLSPVSLTSYYRPEDGSVVQAKLYFYSAGTLDPVAVHTDAGLTIPHSQPVLSGGSGRVPPVFVGQIAAYRVRTFDEFDSLIEDIDGIPSAGAAVTPAPPLDVDPLRLIPTGAIFDFPEAGNPKAGWVRCNGGTIGPPGSGATENASASAEALFKYLWQDPNTVIEPARGASSAGDWTDITTYKRVVVPDYRGRFRATIDGFGRPVANRLTGATFDHLTAIAVGANGGRPTQTLAIVNLPAHNHAVTDPGHVHTGTAAGHNHAWSGVSDSIGSHQHSGTTNAENANHQHTYQPPITAGTVNSGVAFTVAAPGSNTTTGSENNNHAHSFTTGAAGVHQHVITGSNAAAGALALSINANSTGITTNNIGDGTAFSLAPPFQLVATYIKL